MFLEPLLCADTTVRVYMLFHHNPHNHYIPLC